MTDTPEKPANPAAKLAQVREAASLRNMIQRSGSAQPLEATPRLSSFALVANATDVDDTGGRKIVGSILKFKKGKWIAKSINRFFPTGTEMIVRAVKESQAIWANQEVVAEEFRTEANPILPTRAQMAAMYADEFPDLVTTDRDQWPLNQSGDPSDPIQHTFYALMFYRPEVLNFTFITSTIGGRKAVIQLAHEIKWKEQEVGGGEIIYPRVGLEIGEFNSKKYGAILQPALPVKGWVDGALRPFKEEALDDTLIE